MAGVGASATAVASSSKGAQRVGVCFAEPELPEIPDVDKPVVRNVLYTAWALQENSASPCVSWQVQLKPDGYLVLVSYGRAFSMALQVRQGAHIYFSTNLIQ